MWCGYGYSVGVSVGVGMGMGEGEGVAVCGCVGGWVWLRACVCVYGCGCPWLNAPQLLLHCLPHCQLVEQPSPKKRGRNGNVLGILPRKYETPGMCAAAGAFGQTSPPRRVSKRRWAGSAEGGGWARSRCGGERSGGFRPRGARW
eukprot:365412-Chlamydomonas_euryale.AAC.1